MKNPIIQLWQALAFMFLAGVVAWMWRSYPRVEPFGSTGAAWVQAIGSILAIVASGAFAISVPLYLDQRKVRRYRRAWVELLDDIVIDMKAAMFSVETGGQDSAKYVPGTFTTREQQLATFPLHELDDPKALSDAAWARGALLNLVVEIKPELHRPRFVWERLKAFKHNVWQTGVWAKHRYGWPALDTPEPGRQFGTDPALSFSLKWDADGNPTVIPFT